MHLDFEVHDSWVDRSFRLKDENGDVVENFEGQPTLDELRQAERRFGERIDLWQAGLVCEDCRGEINDRFGANTVGQILCWDCATGESAEEVNGIRQNVDPTKAILSESKLHEKSLCDYVINVATGCRHGCKFCYVPTTPGVEGREEMISERAGVDGLQEEWGSYLLYRDDLPERLHRELEQVDDEDWKTTERGRGVVMLSSGTDCYQDRRAAQITRGCVRELTDHGKEVRILTRSPAVTRDIDVFREADETVVVGSSIPSFDSRLVSKMEPGAPPPEARFKALDELHRAGVPVFVSMSPTYPSMDESDFFELLSYFKWLQPEVVFHEPINPRGQNFQMCIEAAREAERTEVVEELRKIRDSKDRWVKYALDQIQTVQRVAEELNVPIHAWPDRELVQLVDADQGAMLRNVRKQTSPEPFEG